MSSTRKRRLRLLTAPLAVALAVVASVLVPSGTSSAGAATTCSTQVNDTAAKLIPCITKADLWRHMVDFQRIADANPGPDGHPSRNSGEPGYRKSALYVARKMRAAGYDVQIQTYRFDYFAFTALPTMSETAPSTHDYSLDSEWTAGQASGSADATLQAAGGIVLPPTASPSSASGCSADDFSGFTAGNIALVQRGTCTFAEKVANAQAAGASAVVIFNEGNPGRTDNYSGTLGSVPSIPVAFTSFDVGQSLYQQATSATPPTLKISTESVHNPNAKDYNVIADSPWGDAKHVVVVDAHLDAIYGAGMLDNASGSTTILDIAEQMKNVHTTNKMRYIWFGGEELGLLGSDYYVNNLSHTELRKIRYDLDADVTATPNYSIGVLDPAGPDLFGRTSSTKFPKGVYEPSKVARDEAVNYFTSIGKNHTYFSPVGTDAFNFNLKAIPASGLLTGQDCCKTQQEVDLFGGYTGNYEGNIPSTDGGCVDNPFRWCDNLSNNDPDVLTFMSKAFAAMTIKMAFDTQTVWGSHQPDPAATPTLKPHVEGALK